MALTRRDLLSRLGFGLTFLPALATVPRSVLGSVLFEPEGERVPARPLPPNPFTDHGKSLVAIVRGQDPTAMLQAGLELLGGLRLLDCRGKRVLIKPNLVNDRPPPTTTSPEVVVSLVKFVKKAGAADVIVADSSGIVRMPTARNFDATGLKHAVESAGARVLPLEEYSWVRVEPPGTKDLPYFYVSKPVYEADLFINVPIVKTHRFAHYSCSLKNLVGIVHPRFRPSVAFLAGNWQERIAELNLAVHPQLTVADGGTIMIAGGPTSGTSAHPGLLVLSGDRVALDAVAVAVIRSFGAWPKLRAGRVWEQRQIRRAAELGLGAGGPAGVEIRSRALAPDPGFERLLETIRKDLEITGPS
jgi:uncharacterized protein (DUF362 family)